MATTGEKILAGGVGLFITSYMGGLLWLANHERNKTDQRISETNSMFREVAGSDKAVNPLEGHQPECVEHRECLYSVGKVGVTDLKAVTDGVITEAGRETITIESGPLRIIYKGVSKVGVVHGQSVRTDQTIGNMMRSPQSDPPHMTVEIWRGKENVTPYSDNPDVMLGALER